jgi:capsular polysaccharide biosynthesis protein
MSQNVVGFSSDSISFNSDVTISSAQLVIHKVHDCFVAPLESPLGDWIQELTGGVFQNDGKFVSASAQTRSYGAVVTPDQASRQIPGQTEHLRSAVFGGVILDHFGHFLLETPARMWALEELPELPWVFLAPPLQAVRNYHYQFLQMLGLPRDRIKLALNWLHVDELLIPAPAIQYDNHVSRDFLRPFRRCPVQPSNDHRGKVYLSRSGLVNGMTAGETELEDLLRKNGWKILQTEKMSAEEQISLFRSDNLLMGLQGSAFHMGLFCKPGRSMVHLCRLQTGRAYQMLDALTLANVTYFHAVESHALEPFGASGPFLLDLDRTEAFLRAEGLINSGIALSSSKRQAIKNEYVAWWHHQKSLQQTYSTATEGTDIEASVQNSFEAVKLFPENHVFREQWISRVRHLNGVAAAIVLLEEAQLAYPNHYKFHYMRSVYEESHGNFDAALVAALEGSRLAPDDLILRYQLALLFYRTRQLNDAELVLRSILVEDPRSASSLYLISLTQRDQKDLDAALKSAEQAALYASHDSTMVAHFIHMLFDNGCLTEARIEAEKAIDRGIKNETIYYLLSVILNQIGETQLAVEASNSALLLAPDNPWIKSHSAQLVQQ